jgi:hypothetical protein
MHLGNWLLIQPSLEVLGRTFDRLEDANPSYTATPLLAADAAPKVRLRSADRLAECGMLQGR